MSFKVFSGIPIQTIRSRRKTACIIIEPGKRVVLRVPLRTGEQEAVHILESKRDFILSRFFLPKTDLIRRPEDCPEGKERDYLAELIHPMARELAESVGVSFRRIIVRSYKNRLGSCHPDGTLRFHTGLVLVPREMLRTVVAHEVAHVLHKNHGTKFWDLVTALSPEQREHRIFLRRYRSKLEMG